MNSPNAEQGSSAGPRLASSSIRKPEACATLPAANVSLNIERLVIEGIPFTPAQREQLQAGLQRELMRLLEGEDHEASWHRLGAVPMLSAPAIDIPAAVRPTELGHQIARSVFASFNQTS